MAWPVNVPILEASDIHKGYYDGPGDTHCLLGWCGAVFGDYSTYDPTKRSRKPADIFLRRLAKAIGHDCITMFNDGNDKHVVADAWNRAAASLGYTVPCER